MLPLAQHSIPDRPPARQMSSKNDLQFYRNPEQEGSVFAIGKETKKKRGDGLVEGFASTFDRPNSPVDWVSIDPDRLGERIPEEEAREIHPRLFEHLSEVESSKERSTEKESSNDNL